MENNKKLTKRDLLSWAIGIFAPIPQMFYYFSRNSGEVQLSWVLLLLGVLCVVSGVLWLAFKLVTKSSLIGTVACVVAWLCLYNCSKWLAFVNSIGITKFGLWLLGVIALAIIFLIWKLFKKHPQFETAGLIFISVLFAMLLVINTIPIISFAVNSAALNNADKVIRTEFLVDDQKQDEPNIYWIHCDGMLSPSAYSKYFEEDFWFYNELEQRGFHVNSSGEFEAAKRTRVALTCLMCPSYYDGYLAPLLATHEDAMKLDTGAKILVDVRMENELIRSLEKTGYNTICAATASLTFPVNTDRFYDCYSGKYLEDIDPYAVMENSNYWEILYFQQLQEFATEICPPVGDALNLIAAEQSINDAMVAEGQPIRFHLTEEQQAKLFLTEDSEEYTRTLAQSFYDSLDDTSTGANFTFYSWIIAHSPYRYDSDGYLLDVGTNDPKAYKGVYEYSSKVLLAMVDEIMLRDPDAVIILEADHGLHLNTEEEFKEAFGDDADPLELWNSVLSCVRIPEQYQNGEEKYAYANPLNISRYLVNNFVGEGNYEYIE